MNNDTSVRQDSTVPCDAPFDFSNSIELLTALLSGKTLVRMLGTRKDMPQQLWCDWFNGKPHFYVDGWGSAYGNAMDRVIGIIETNGAEWRIELPTAQGSVATKVE
jgi:hypothetical protein